ncbi:MAG: KpsF/GutQ family sugar-phosphate isomerase [Bacteroidota bacterium]
MTSSNYLIVKTATDTINIEAQTIANLVNYINEDFISTTESIYHCEGRVIVTGIGKSALIGRKIVATLNSTGTPAVFMHAADAIHGDLGMIQAKDVVLCLSKSGETAEIKVLIPMLKQLGSQLVAMTSRKQSYLAQHSEFLLLTPVSKEADPNNLAPTASTAAQMAMGDALATALLAMRGFSPKDFAQFHPGGSLGKRLYLRVNSLCKKDQCPAVRLDDSIRRTIVEISSKRLGCTAVLDSENKVKGIITDGDLRRMLEQEEQVAHLRAADIMTPNPLCVQKEMLAAKALKIMSDESITQLVVLEEDEYIGVIHLHDLVREGIV